MISPGQPVDILTDFALILCVAAVTTVVFQRIRQPVVLGYLVAGLIVGPHLPVPLFADAGVAHMLSELGVILLMSSLGLEFSLRKLLRVGPTAAIVAVIQCSLMMWLGYLSGRLLGWTAYESLFAGAVVAISSTTIIIKAFAEQGITGRLAEMVFGILVVEDLIAVVLLALLTAVASGVGLSASALVLTMGRLAGFLVALLVVGMLVVPRLVRLVVRLGRAETTLVASVGICFALALIARRLGYSVALGAFLGGALLAESGEARTLEKLIEPVRDIFAAVFFVSVGMLIDPRVLAQHWVAVLILTAVVVVGKVVGVTLGAFIAGNGVRTSIQAGMSLAQIGEFSFIIAGVGLALGATGDFLYPVAVAVSALTTLLTPVLIRVAGPVASAVDRHLPHALQTFASLYGSWVGQLGATTGHRTAWARIRRLAGLVLLDAALIGAIAIGTSLAAQRLIRLGREVAHLPQEVARILVVAGAVALAVPFMFGAVRTARALGLALAAEALPSGQEAVDLSAAPRRALLVALQIAILLVVGTPLVALTQPFLPSFPGAIVLLLLAIALVVPLWRSAADLHGHVRAGAQVILEALSAQSQPPSSPSSPPATGAARGVERLMPGLGEPSAFFLRPGLPHIGSTLRQVNLRGLTGAIVIAIERSGHEVVFPTGDEVLREGDTVVLAGTREAVEAGIRLLSAT
jgi:CPA2 family monovalent cation:H+ antiporter-2